MKVKFFRWASMKPEQRCQAETMDEETRTIYGRTIKIPREPGIGTALTQAWIDRHPKEILRQTKRLKFMASRLKTGHWCSMPNWRAQRSYR